MPTAVGNYAPTDPEWLLREDKALKASLGGLTVSDANNASRPVGVWFSQPDPEARNQKYPYITIDMIDVVEYTPAIMSQYGMTAEYNYLLAQLPTYDTNTQEWGDLTTGTLLPMLLIYQVSTWARHPRHDRQLLQQLSKGAMHPRFAQVTCDDNTVRRVIVRGMTKRDTTDEKQKRLFRNIWTVAMVSEMFGDEVNLTQRVSQVIINPGTPTPPSTMLTPVYYP